MYSSIYNYEDKEVHVMRSGHKPFARFGAVLLALAMSFSLVCCTVQKPPAQNGIRIDPAPTYTYKDESLEYAKNVFYSVLYAIDTENGEKALTAGELANIKNTADALVAITADGSISEERYLAALRALYQKSETVASVVLGKAPLLALKELYATLSDLIGKSYVGSCLYEALMQGFENKHKSALEKYEQSGTGAHLVIAERQKKNVAALSQSIGKENISRLLDYVFLFSELTVSGAFEAGSVSLSDSEVLLLLSYLDPSALTVGAEGWELIFNLSADAVLLSDEPSFLRKMQFAAAKNGDGAELSKKMNCFIRLICSVQQRLDETAVSMMREGKGMDLVLRMVSTFNREDFENLDAILSISFENLEYSTLAKSYYGADYTAFYQNIESCTIEQLISEQNSDTLKFTLKGYIAGKCPALAYAIFEADD